jgi:hypothetical protein
LVAIDRENEAARAVIHLSGLRDAVLARLSKSARKIQPLPLSLVIFGSFARGMTRPDSDVDVLAVRSEGVGADDERWRQSFGGWLDGAARIVGNPVNSVELAAGDLEHSKVGRGSFWSEVAEDGIPLIGRGILYKGGRITLAPIADDAT